MCEHRASGGCERHAGVEWVPEMHSSCPEMPIICEHKLFQLLVNEFQVLI